MSEQDERRLLLMCGIFLMSIFGGVILMFLKPYPTVTPINGLGALFFVLGMTGLLYVSVKLEGE